jgi:lactate dehydrogenase-like 2-hydroxyacid dehydrogenase
VKSVAVAAHLFDRAPEVFTAEAAALGLHCLRAPDAESELAAFVREHSVAHVIVSTAPYRGPLYAALPAGGVIARFGVGYDNLDLAQAAARGQHCTNTPGILEGAVAEHTLALLLAAARRLPAMDARLRQGRWEARTGTDLAGKTLVIIGCGRIGNRVALAASRGLGMRVLGLAARAEDAPRLLAQGAYAAVTPGFAELAAAADFVSLHLPGRPALRHHLNAARLALLKPGAWLINTARGSLVDEAALFDALQAGRLGGAALDVFEHEPYRPVHPDKDLRTLENVILTPHAASNTAETNAAIARRALANIAAAEAGRLEAMDLLLPGGPAA